MKKSLHWLFVSVFLSTFLMSCSTISTAYQNEDIKIIASGNKGSNDYIALSVENNSDEMMFVNLNKSAFTSNGATERVVSGETRLINANLAQADLPISPSSTTSVDLYNAKTDSTKTEHLNIEDESTLNLCYNINNTDNYATVYFSEYNTKSDEVVGQIEKTGTNWNFFFVKKPIEDVFRELEELAIQKYGQNAKVINMIYESNWSPLSLVLYLNVLGYVEKYTAIGDVVLL